MKRNNLQWALPLAALCLLATACSNNDYNEPTVPNTRSLTLNCNIGTADVTLDTRAGIKPGTYEVMWHQEDYFHSFIMPAGEGYSKDKLTFNIDLNYNHKENPSNSAKFTCNNIPAEGSYKMLAAYQKPANYTFALVDGKPELSFSFKNESQIGNNTNNHLEQSMCMYATATISNENKTPNMTFRHLTSLFRFTVTNKNDFTCRIKEIKVSSSKNTKIFGTGYTLEVTNWDNGTIKTTCTESASSITQILEDTDKDWLGSGFPLSKDSIFEAYTTVGGNTTAPLNDDELIFTITVRDEKGKNERTYTTLALDADAIIGENAGATTWEPGKLYWFKLLLDNGLSVTLKSTTDIIPGWGEENEL